MRYLNLRAVLLAVLVLAGQLWTATAHAQPRLTNNTRVTAEQIEEAIRNSPNASPWLRANARAVANLAMFESGGNLSIYNGSCCYGILQMNQRNISRYTNLTPEQFRNLPLQDQINAWARLTNDALRSRVVQSLIALGTFDGRPVDGNLVLACVQLGIGNCQRMIRSGRCNGFADRNGTTICDMADRIAGRGRTPQPNPVPTPPAPGAGGGTPAPGQPGPGMASGGSGCIRDAQGGCLPMSEAMRQGFESGSGVSMERLRSTIQLILAALAFAVTGSAMLGTWQSYSNGAITKAAMITNMQRGLVVIGLVFVVISVL